VLIVASLAFIILTVFYLIIDIGQWLTGASFVWLGVNSMAMYLAQKYLKNQLPVQISVEKSHANLIAPFCGPSSLVSCIGRKFLL
jgi:heparan-alpha-glucosaminide N-acetyltransferase